MHQFFKFIFGIKLYMFRTVPLSIISSFSLYTQQWYMSYSLRAGSGRSVLILLASCQQTCMTYTVAVCTVKNSWWWTEELSETCRVLFQNKFEKLVHLVGFIIRIYHDVQSSERQRSYRLPNIKHTKSEVSIASYNGLFGEKHCIRLQPWRWGQYFPLKRRDRLRHYKTARQAKILQKKRFTQFIKTGQFNENNNNTCTLNHYPAIVENMVSSLLLLLLLLFSRLYNVSTSSCVHLAIILSSSSSCLCHSSLLPLIPFPQQSPNPFRPGSFRSTSFSSSWWAPFHNLFW